MTAPVRIGYIGNFGPRHSTENHIAAALTTLGHTVERYQEDAAATWAPGGHIASSTADLILWTHTGGMPPDAEIQWAAADCYMHRGPIVGVHLDRWWGLPREAQITEDRKPFFYLPDVLYTADGGHGDLWEQYGIEHRWFPPGVSAAECVPHPPARMFAADVVFVGGWQGSYHPEWPHRRELVEFLQRWGRDTGRRVRFFPEPGKAAVRGRALRALYASCRVAVGDSCLVPRPCRECGDAGSECDRCGSSGSMPMVRYCSDRVPETIGRGAALVHPFVTGVVEESPGALYQSGVHLAGWPLGDWDRLAVVLEELLDDEAGTAAIAAAGRAHVLAEHTYEVRMAQLLDEVL